MDLAKSCDYAVRGLLYLAQQDDPFEPVLLREIARRADAPEPYLSKVFQGLRASNLVRSHRGRRRGYSLARSPRKISLYDVILALEGPAALRSIPEGSDVDPEEEPFRWVWGRIEEQFVDTMRQTTLRSILQQTGEVNA